MPFKVVFFNGDTTVVPGDSEEEAVDAVWHFTSAKIETLTEISDADFKGQSDEKVPQVREG